MPKIRCKRCQKVLNHPTATEASGTTNMRKHLESTGCKDRKRSSETSTLELAFGRVSTK